MRLIALLLLTMSTVTARALDSNAALRMVAALPEVAELEKEVKERTNGGVRIAVIEDGAAKDGWYIAVNERHAQKVVRRLTFQVRTDASMLAWIEDEQQARYVPLAEWRKLRQQR